MCRVSTVEARLRLWQLLSPAMPSGVYAYSRGLEYAVEAGWVCDEAGTAEWIGGQLRHTVQGLDIPVFARLYRAWAAGDSEGLEQRCSTPTSPRSPAARRWARCRADLL
jgi:urease accessory protein UreF